MRLRNWIRRRKRQFRRKRAAKKLQGSPLREFVYLDEVSVYSLIASRLGAVAKEFTETESTSLRSGFATSVGGSAGLAKGEVASEVEAHRSKGSQVVRMSIVQATFRELMALEKDTLAIGDNTSLSTESSINSIEDLRAAISNKSEGSIIGTDSLDRGQLLEIEVELETDPIFRMSMILTTLIGILDENPALLNAEDLPGILDSVTGNRILDKLLAGLVPLRGRAVDYEHVSIDGKEWIIRSHLLSSLQDGASLERRPLYLVGVAETELFWRDIRRVLFSGARYSVMCRLGRDGVQRDWTPVKLVDVLGEIMPELGRQLEEASSALSVIGGRVAADSPEMDPKKALMRSALVTYATRLASHHDKSYSEAELEAHGLLSDENCSSYETLDEQRATFRAVTAQLQQDLEIEIDALEAAQHRIAAVAEVGLDSLDGPALLMPSAASSGGLASERRYLDAEIVAIYW